MNQKLGANSVLRFAYARYLMPTSNVRDTLGDFVNQYAGFAQTTNTLGLANGVPRQNLADPFPSSVNPVIEPYGQSYGRYTNLGSAVSLDQYQLRPQVNDRFNLSYQRQIWAGTIIDRNYFYNYGTRVPFDKNLNMADPAFRYEYKTLLNTQVANPFRNYLTPDKFPGQLRNTTTVSLGSLLVPYPQYGAITQTNTDGRKMRTQTFEIRAQRPFAKGTSFLVSYAYNNEKRQEWFDDIAQYKIFTTGEGWEWRPTDLPQHRVTGAVTWQIPVGRERAYLSSLPLPLDLAIGGWQYTAATRYYSGRLLLFGNSYVVDANPKLAKPTRDRLVRHERLSHAGLVHAAQQCALLRWPHRPERVRHRYDAHEELQSDEQVPDRSARRGLQRLQQHHLGQPGRRSRECDLREGHAETDRRGRAGDTDRRKIRVLIERCLRKTATSRATRSTGSAPSCVARRFARWWRRGSSVRRARHTRSNEP